MKLSCETSLGTPPGGAIILGRLEGMPTLVEAVGEGTVEPSWTMLVRMAREVSVLVAVGATVRMGLCELVIDGIVGMAIVAESLAEALLADAVTLADAGADADTERDSDAERVAEGATEDSEANDPVPEADGEAGPVATDVDSVAEAVGTALLEIRPEEVGLSEAGMEDGMLRDSLGKMVALDETPVPTEVDGTMPEETSVPESVNEGRTPEEADNEALAEGVTLSVPVGRGVTEPDTVAEGRIPDDTRPDEKSDAMLEAMLLTSEVGMGTGTEPVGRIEPEVSADSALDTKLEITLGRAEPVGTTEMADDRRLDSSETTDGRTDGKMPEADGDGVIVAETGAVGLTEPELGRTPVGATSETNEDRSEDKSTSAELVGVPSEVGMAPEAWLVIIADADADSVPSAVVIPMIIPLEGRPLEAPVGTTPLLGRIPDSTLEVGVGSAPRSVDKREPTRPAEVVGRTISEESGRRPVEAT